MLKKRCQLCGGKLSDGRCTLCGLDNSKSDENYRVNRSSCDDRPLTHVHEEKPQAEVRAAKKTVPVNRTAPEKKTIPAKKTAPVRNAPVRPKKAGAGSARKRRRADWKLIVSILVLVNTFGRKMLENIEFPDAVVKPVWEMVADPEREIYSEVTRELPESGEAYKTFLEQGMYIVGVHIPEGCYRIEEAEDDGGSGFVIQDSENGIFYSGGFADQSAQEYEDDIRCYAGAKLKIRGAVNIFAENAQTDTMVNIENPLTDAVLAEDGDIAGESFPAGTYDIEVLNVDPEEIWSFAYIVPGTVEEGDEESVTERIWLDTTSEEIVYRNIYLPEGTEIRIEGEVVSLVPSEVIPESYDGYYELITE